MKKDTIKNKIQDKLSNRKIVPSENAWNRLESMLDKESVAENKNKVVNFRKWFWIAASLLLFSSVMYLINFDAQKPQIVKENKQNVEIDSDLDKNNEKVEIVDKQVEKIVETNLGNIDDIEKNEIVKQEIQNPKVTKTQFVAKTTKIEEVKNKNTEIALLKEDEFISQDSLVLDDAGFKDFKEIQLAENKAKEKPKSYVNPDLLLFSVENEVYHERNPNQKTTKIAYIIYDEINKQLSK
ncbi:MAG: hypothetical protein H6604_00665 [Flavobacteriales bacterium]|nr:hypothetical protein [Flavobacteriales bacterium]